MIAPGQLDELGPGNARRQIPALLDAQALIARAMEHQRRYFDRWQHATNVDVRVHSCQRHRGTWTRAHPQVRRPPGTERCIIGARRGALLDANWAAPLFEKLLAEQFAFFYRSPPRV